MNLSSCVPDVAIDVTLTMDIKTKSSLKRSHSFGGFLNSKTLAPGPPVLGQSFRSQQPNKKHLRTPSCLYKVKTPKVARPQRALVVFRHVKNGLRCDPNIFALLLKSQGVCRVLIIFFDVLVSVWTPPSATSCACVKLKTCRRHRPDRCVSRASTGAHCSKF